MDNPIRLLQFTKSNRLPVTLQSEAAECGLACIAMIANYHGHRVDMNSLRRNYPVSLKGANLRSLMLTADRLHFACRAVRLELDALNKLRRPAILHWDMSHFVVLKKVSAHAIVVHDPAFGERKLPWKSASTHFTGVALELTPTNDFERKDEEQRVRLSDLWQSITGLRRTVMQILFLSALLQVFAIVSPFFMQLVVDEVIVSHDFSMLMILAIGFSLLMLIQVGVTALRSLIVLYMGTQLDVQIAANLLRHLLQLPMSFFSKRHIGDIISRFGSLEAIEELLTKGVIEGIIDGVMVIATLVMMYLYSPPLASIVLSVGLLYVLIRIALYRPLRRMTEEEIVANAKEDSNFMETVRGMQSIRLFGTEAQRQTLWHNYYTDARNAGIRLGKLRIGYVSINGLLFGLENVVVIYLAAKLAIANQISIGMIFAFMAYKQQFTSKVASFIEQLIEFKMLGLHLARIGDIALTPREKDLDSSVEERPLKGDLRLEHLSFRYSEAEPLLFDDINIAIKAGESVCLVGPSGCGKTTLMKVMLGLLEPTRGNIFADGVELRKFGLRRYRSEVASVMQDDQLFSGSIADNICCFDANFDQRKIEDCATLAAIHQDIVAMPMAYSSLIGDMGTTLSGGQKQRVVLARALYHMPRILFLDEATSHLDTDLESVVNKNIESLGITRVVIAHRPETIKYADRVLLVEAGRIQEVLDVDSPRQSLTGHGADARYHDVLSP